MELPINYKEIVKLLPHRYPFLLVDRIIELDLGEKVTGIKNVTSNEHFFQGHFPDNPVMPGVLIIEAMAQVGGILARLSIEDEMKDKGDTPPSIFFMSIDKVKFRKPVIPGDQLVIEVKPIRTGSRVWKMEGRSFVEGALVSQAEFMAAIQ
ncbi:MAG: 3-hydroxyacyl-ACP dehydratase FabZ [Deltaproteobacteria bacterium]|nr:3-hydroxyacyl-ACP dehydratase FabZ [Deltaproteobacteria bacterium]MBW1913398.1 3-hydroxyacyl-ACP dehydratase FabZ [Deltaproteobacteria bacterium]